MLHYYDHDYIKKWLSDPKHPNCPMTRLSITTDDLIFDHDLEKEILDFVKQVELSLSINKLTQSKCYKNIDSQQWHNSTLFFHKTAIGSLINNRHVNPKAQNEYDKQYGLMPFSNTSS